MRPLCVGVKSPKDKTPLCYEVNVSCFSLLNLTNSSDDTNITIIILSLIEPILKKSKTKVDKSWVWWHNKPFRVSSVQIKTCSMLT